MLKASVMLMYCVSYIKFSEPPGSTSKERTKPLLTKCPFFGDSTVLPHCI